MSFIVKGIELPVNCFRCPLNWGERRPEKNPYILCVYTKKAVPCKDGPYDRLPCCKLGEVPTPHGNLVDVDVIKKRINYVNMEAYMDGVCYGIHPRLEYLDLLNEILDDAPTIIPAEE